jgi:hypothetical protein
MFRLIIPSIELFDEKNNEFFKSKEQELQLEHSLVSISKWESKWKKPFLAKTNKTKKEIIDYIRMMTITQNVDPYIYNYIQQESIDLIMDYIYDSMTATTIVDTNKKKSNEVITSEIIYYWMVTFNIPFECQKWHLNRLLTLINVCNIKNQPAKKQTRRELLAERRALNEARKAKLTTKG